MVLKRKIRIELRNGEVLLWTGELYVVPKGIEHETVENEEVHLLFNEPKGTLNTGDPATAAKNFNLTPFPNVFIVINGAANCADGAL